MNDCCKAFPTPSGRFTDLACSTDRNGTLYQCSYCGNLFEAIENNKSYLPISHPEARKYYDIINKQQYLDEQDWERVNSLDKDLKTILTKELEAGNLIFETKQGWPLKTSILVLLSKPFKDTWDVGSAVYHGVNNPYYWKGEYRVPKKDHTLACKF